MAVRGIPAGRLADIREGFRQVKQMIAKATRSGNLRGLVRDLRAIPSSDREKKRELANFFQSDVGQRYSRDEQREAYNQLLGERNNRQRG